MIIKIIVIIVNLGRVNIQSKAIRKSNRKTSKIKVNSNNPAKFNERIKFSLIDFNEVSKRVLSEYE